MSFKEILESDVHEVFMNVDEFSDMHMVNGKEMAVQIDSNEQIEREKRMNQHVDGVYKNNGYKRHEDARSVYDLSANPDHPE